MRKILERERKGKDKTGIYKCEYERSREGNIITIKDEESFINGKHSERKATSTERDPKGQNYEEPYKELVTTPKTTRERDRVHEYNEVVYKSQQNIGCFADQKIIDDEITNQEVTCWI